MGLQERWEKENSCRVAVKCEHRQLVINQLHCGTKGGTKESYLVAKRKARSEVSSTIDSYKGKGNALG